MSGDKSSRGSTASAPKPKAVPGKRWLKRILLVLAAFLLLTLAFAVWVFNTEAGARFAFRFLPSELSVAGISGTFASSLIVNKLEFKIAGTEVTLVNGKITPRWRQLLSKKIAIDDLELDGLHVILNDTPATDEPPGTTSRNPLLLLRNLKLNNVLIEKNGAVLMQINKATAATLNVRGERIEFEDLRIDEQRATLVGSGALDLSGNTQSAVKFAIKNLMPTVAASGTLSGTPKKFSFTAALDAPNEMKISGELTEALSPQMRWNATVTATDLALAQFELADLGLAVPVQTLSADLNASGSLRSVKLRGSLKLDQDQFAVRDLDVELSGAASLKISALELALPGDGSVSLSGLWPLSSVAEGAPDAEVKTGKIELNWSKFRLPTRFGWPVGLSSARGSVDVLGSLEHFQADIDFSVQQVQPELSGQIQGKVSRQLMPGVDQFTFAPLQIENSDGGNLAASGALSIPVNEQGAHLSSELTWTLELIANQLNPALIANDWPGSIGLRAQTVGKLVAGKPSADLQIDELSGTLKAQPLSGQGALKFSNSLTPTGTLALRWGVNAVDFSANKSGDVQANIDIAELGALLADAAGSVQGGVTLRQANGAKNAGAFTLDGALSARLLRFNGISVDTLEVTAELPSDESAPITLKLDAANLELAGQRINQANFAIAGTRAQHRMRADIAAELGAFALAAQGGLVKQKQTTAWRGQLDTLTLTPAVKSGKTASSLQLQAPVNLRVTPDNIALERACFEGMGVALCGVLDWAKVGATKANLELVKLDLAQLQGALDIAVDSVSVTGVIGGRVSAELLAGNLTALDASIAPISGSALKLTFVRLDSDDVAVEISDFGLTAATAAGAPPVLNLQLNVKDAGSIKANDLVLRGGELGGTLDIDLTSLKAFNGLSESVVNPNGQVKGTLSLAGSAAAPNMRGKITLSQLALELPAAGLKLNAGTIDINSDGDRLNVDGSIHSGPGSADAAGAGVLKVSGWLAPFATAKAEIKIIGNSVLLADTPSVRVIASPDLLIVHTGSRIKITGALVLPSANLQLDRFESNVTRSPDVVVIDDKKVAPSTPIQADVTVTLGDDVALKGFGLNGKLSGRLKIRERPNKSATARGEIEVEGKYKAYGQDLLIERGKLLFSSTPLDDPGLDIRAVRKIDDIRAGVQVRGTALRPQLTVWSDPIMEQSDVLSYIVLGRPLKGGSGADSALVGQAAKSLGTAGGNLLARGLGQKVGLELGVETLSDIGGPAFTAGKYLSPALYVGYGQGLFNPQTLFILRYKLFDHYELEALSGREQKIGVNYRRER